MPRMGRVVAPPAGTVANTSHCKSPVESREPLEGLSHCSAGFQDLSWCSAGSRPRPITDAQALTLTTLHLVFEKRKEMKKRKSEVLIALVETLQLCSLGSDLEPQRGSVMGEKTKPRAFSFLSEFFCCNCRGGAAMLKLPETDWK